MHPSLFGVLGPGFLNQVPTLWMTPDKDRQPHDGLEDSSDTCPVKIPEHWKQLNPKFCYPKRLNTKS